jgi:hypothetical protein
MHDVHAVWRRWNAAEQVTAVAHDNPIPGFDTRNTINLRLWAAKPDKEFDLEAFNTGDYVQVCAAVLGSTLCLLVGLGNARRVLAYCSGVLCFCQCTVSVLSAHFQCTVCLSAHCGCCQHSDAAGPAVVWPAVVWPPCTVHDAHSRHVSFGLARAVAVRA